MQRSKRIFLVDDNIVNLKIGKRILQENYTVVPVPSGKKLLEMLDTYDADLILLDVRMPELDGYEVLRRLKANTATADIPVVMLSGRDDDSGNRDGFALGAAEYINKPFSESLLLNRVEHLLQLEQQKKELQNFAENFRNVAAGHKETVESMQRAIVLWTADLIEFCVGADHENRSKVQYCLKVLLSEMLKDKLYADEITGWEIEIDTIVQAATLHDIGKIRVPDNILQKLKKLDVNEYEQIKEHAVYGRTLIEILKSRLQNQKFLDYAQTMAFMHHERWDGTGYPLGMKGEEIPLLARTMAIVDVYTALTSKRAYKEVSPHGEALAIISAGQGTQFDPKLVKLFLSVSDKLRDVSAEPV